MTVSEALLRRAYVLASILFYRKADYADWMFEKCRRPGSAVALLLNWAYYALRVPKIHRVVTSMIEPVFGCNLRCKTCWGVLDLEGKRPYLMEWDLFRKIVDQMPATVEAITFSLMGEPMLHPRITDMIAYAASRGFRTILFTNGTLLSGARLEALAQAPLDVLNVSIEADPVNAREMRGIDLDALRDNVRAFIAMKRPETAVKLSLVAHAGNLERLPNVREEWSDLAKDIKISPRLGFSEACGEPPLCLEPWRGNLNFYTDGTVSPCCRDFFGDLSIGNLRAQDLGDLIAGEPYRDLLRRFLKGDAPMACRHCKEFTVPGAPLRLRKRPIRRRSGNDEAGP